MASWKHVNVLIIMSLSSRTLILHPSQPRMKIKRGVKSTQRYSNASSKGSSSLESPESNKEAMVFLTLLNTLSCRCTLTPSKYLLDCSQFPIQYCFVRSSGSSAYRYGRSFLFHVYRGGGCRVLFRPPLPKVDLTHTASKMTTRDAKRSISTILRKNRELWTVYISIHVMKWNVSRNAKRD